ncbi:MAG: hypothetical protein ACK4Q4_06240, partial [Rhodocyclaceae bacterium]
MRKIIAGAMFALISFFAHALQPYVLADKVPGGDLKTAMSAAEQKLSAAGFTVIGRHMPPGIPGHGTLVVTEPGLTGALVHIGGKAIVGVPIRVGVKADGTVSYLNLEYWQRAFLRNDFGKAEGAVKAASSKLAQALGAGKPFGGEVKAEDLPT